MITRTCIAALALLFVAPFALAEETFSGGAAVNAAELQQARGRQVPLPGLSPEAFAAALGGEDAGGPEGFAAFLAALFSTGGAEIYNVAPSDTSGGMLQTDGVSIAGRADTGDYSAQHSLPGGMDQQGLFGVVTAFRPEQ